MELKINSLLQRAVVMAQPRAAAVVPGLSPEGNWIGVEVEGGHHPAGGGTGALRAVADASLGMAPPWHCSPLTMCPGWEPCPARPAEAEQLPPVTRSGRAPACAVPDLLPGPGS